MAADLSFARLTHYESMLIGNEGLIVLTSGSFRDRMSTILFDRVESVLIWKTVPWSRLFFSVLFALLGGFLLLTPAYVGGWIVLGTATIAIVRYLYCHKTTIRITRAGKSRDFVGILRPGKVLDFAIRLRHAIEQAQQCQKR